MITRKEALQELLAKVDAGENPSGNTQFWADLETAFPKNARAVGDFAKAFYGSIDAAKALHEAVLQGWRYNLGWTTGDERVFASVWPCSNMWGWIDANAETAARAWLIAIIKALIAQEPT